MLKPIEKYNQIQANVQTFVAEHSGDMGKVVSIMNQAGQSYFNMLLNRFYQSDSRPVKKVQMVIDAGHIVNARVFSVYLSSVVENPKITFSDLSTSFPRISIYNGSSFVSAMDLSDSAIKIKGIKEETNNTDADLDRFTIKYTNLLHHLDYQIRIVIVH